MSDLIERQAALNEAYTIVIDGEVFRVVQVETLEGLPSAEPEYILRIHQNSIEWLRRDNAVRELYAEFISWLLDEVWDDELWELNYRAFPELLCRRLVKNGWLKEEGGKYVRLDKQTGSQITVCPMCPDCPDNCPLEADMREENNNG